MSERQPTVKEVMQRVSYETALEEIIRYCDQDGYLAEDFPKMFVKMVRTIAEIGLKWDERDTR